MWQVLSILVFVSKKIGFLSQILIQWFGGSSESALRFKIAPSAELVTNGPSFRDPMHRGLQGDCPKKAGGSAPCDWRSPGLCSGWNAALQPGQLTPRLIVSSSDAEGGDPASCGNESSGDDVLSVDREIIHDLGPNWDVMPVTGACHSLLSQRAMPSAGKSPPSVEW
jgi:hypothetical protein